MHPSRNPGTRLATVAAVVILGLTPFAAACGPGEMLRDADSLRRGLAAEYGRADILIHDYDGRHDVTAAFSGRGYRSMQSDERQATAREIAGVIAGSYRHVDRLDQVIVEFESRRGFGPLRQTISYRYRFPAERLSGLESEATTGAPAREPDRQL
jgi:hypothetical protein